MECEKICHACLHLEDDKSPLLKLLPPSDELHSKSARRLYEVLYEILETNEESQLDQICEKCSVMIREMYSFISNCEKSKFILKGLRRVCTELKNDSVNPFIAKRITVKNEKPDSEDNNAVSSNHIVENDMDVASSSPIIENDMNAVPSNPIVENDMDVATSSSVNENDMDAVSSNPIVENDMDVASASPIIENATDAGSSNPIVENDIDAVAFLLTVENDISAVSSNRIVENDISAVSSNSCVEGHINAVSNSTVENPTETDINKVIKTERKDEISVVSSNSRVEDHIDAVSNPTVENPTKTDIKTVIKTEKEDDISTMSSNSRVEDHINAVSNRSVENPTEMDIKTVIKTEREDNAESSEIMVKEEPVDFEEYDTRLEGYEPGNDFEMQSTNLGFVGVQIKLERNDDSAETRIENQSVQDEIETNDDSDLFVFEINEENDEFDTEMATNSNEADANNKIGELSANEGNNQSGIFIPVEIKQEKDTEDHQNLIEETWKRPQPTATTSKNNYTNHHAHATQSTSKNVDLRKVNVKAIRDLYNKLKMPKTPRRELNQYSCDYCDFTFRSKGQYTTHVAMHKDYLKCDQCDAAFQHSNSLAAHKRSHVVQKQQPKRNCSKKAKPKGGRREAVRYKCEYCEFSFIMENQYNTHLALHMAHTFECHECGMAFQNQDSLTAHKQQRHCLRAAERLAGSDPKAKSYMRR